MVFHGEKIRVKRAAVLPLFLLIKIRNTTVSKNAEHGSELIRKRCTNYRLHPECISLTFPSVWIFLTENAECQLSSKASLCILQIVHDAGALRMKAESVAHYGIGIRRATDECAVPALDINRVSALRIVVAANVTDCGMIDEAPYEPFLSCSHFVKIASIMKKGKAPGSLSIRQ